jgi:hypothetical protein
MNGYQILERVRSILGPHGYSIWMAIYALCVIFGAIYIIPAYNNAVISTGISELGNVWISSFLLFFGLKRLFYDKKEGTFKISFRGERGVVDFSRDIKIGTPYGIVLIPGGSASQYSNLKIYWKRGMGTRILSASEWFNY